MKIRNAGKQQQNIDDQVPAWVLDLLLGIAVTLVIALVISADQGGRQRPDLLAYLFAAGFGGLMLVRRHFPVVVLVGTMFLLFAYYALGYPAIGLAVPVSAALYSAAELGRLLPAVMVSLLLIVVSTYFRVLDGQSLAFLLGYELISAVTMMAAAIALGDSTRARRALRAEQEQTAQLIAQDHAYRAEQRVQAERVRMARDLHDVIGLGESNDEIAAKLTLSPATARTYVSRLLSKLAARDRSQLVIIAYESGLVRPGQG